MLRSQARVRRFVPLLGVAIVAVAFTLAFVLRDRDDDRAPGAPIDPQVQETINQARGLQKLGRWQEAAELLQGLADLGHPEAIYHLARAYKNGWGVTPDLERARHLFKDAVRSQFRYRPQTAYEIGRLYQRASGADCSSIAVEWFSRSLAWGHLKAHAQLAKHYERGLGVEQDLDRAFHHYEQAAIAGYPTSTITYARILASGRYGITPDAERAAFWAAKAIKGLRKKAAAGSPSATKTIARLFRDGEFVDRDLELAQRWFRRASRLGDPGAMHDLANLLIAIAPGPDIHPEALDWLRSAAQAGHGGAMTTLGRLHLAEVNGLNKGGAVEWFERGVGAGHAGSMEELARIYLLGQLLPADFARAEELARRGAEQGHQGARSLLKDLRSKRQPA